MLFLLWKLKKISKYADFSNSNIKSLGYLKSISKSMFLKNSKLKPSDFKNVKVGGKIIN